MPVPAARVRLVAPVVFPILTALPVASVPMLSAPVVLVPRTNGCMLVVARVPPAVRYAPPVVPVPAETDAVGVLLFMLRTANFAEAVEVPPKRVSRVVLMG